VFDPAGYTLDTFAYPVAPTSVDLPGFSLEGPAWVDSSTPADYAPAPRLVPVAGSAGSTGVVVAPGVIEDQNLYVTRGESTTFRCTVTDAQGTDPAAWSPVAVLKVEPATETSDEPDPDSWTDRVVSTAFTLAANTGTTAVLDVHFLPDQTLALRAGYRTAVLAVRDTVTRLGLVQPTWVSVRPDCE